jgi:hypothetical protein
MRAGILLVLAALGVVVCGLETAVIGGETAVNPTLLEMWESEVARYHAQEPTMRLAENWVEAEIVGEEQNPNRRARRGT